MSTSATKCQACRGTGSIEYGYNQGSIALSFVVCVRCHGTGERREVSDA